jgi:hypothetical protein
MILDFVELWPRSDIQPGPAPLPRIMVPTAGRPAEAPAASGAGRDRLAVGHSRVPVTGNG